MEDKAVTESAKEEGNKSRKSDGGGGEEPDEGPRPRASVEEMEQDTLPKSKSKMDEDASEEPAKEEANNSVRSGDNGENGKESNKDKVDEQPGDGDHNGNETLGMEDKATGDMEDKSVDESAKEEEEGDKSLKSDGGGE
jgi:hypothetical protein